MIKRLCSAVAFGYSLVPPLKVIYLKREHFSSQDAHHLSYSGDHEVLKVTILFLWTELFLSQLSACLMQKLLREG